MTITPKKPHDEEQDHEPRRIMNINQTVVVPKKPRIRFLRYELNRSTGRQEPIYKYVFNGDHLAVEAWERCHPMIGTPATDNRRAPG